MPQEGAASTTRRSAAAPARWPAMRGSPRCVAQRPLPSIMMAACNLWCFSCEVDMNFDVISFELTVAHGVNQRFHVIEILFQCLTACLRKTVFGARHAAFKRLSARNVVGLFQFSRVHTQVSIGGIETLLEVVEG